MYANTLLSSEKVSDWKTRETSSLFELGRILKNSAWGVCLAFYCKSKAKRKKTEEQGEITINVNILDSCGHCRFLCGCENKLPSLNQETLDIGRNWLVAKRQCLFTRLHSQTESLGHNPILLKTSNCLRLPGICLRRHYGFISLDTKYFIISCLCWSYVFPYLTQSSKSTQLAASSADTIQIGCKKDI